MNTYRLKGASAKVANQSFGLGTRTLIGNSPECEVNVTTDQTNGQIAEITLQENGELHLKQLEKSIELRVNGEPVEQTSLASGDEIRIGSYRWVLQAPGLRPEKVLTVDAVKPKRSYLPWLIAAMLLATAVLAWQQAWLVF